MLDQSPVWSLSIPSDGICMFCIVGQAQVAGIEGGHIQVRRDVLAEPWMALDLVQRGTLFWVGHKHTTQQILQLI